ncbi:MAG: glucokinase [Rhodopseudomonas sp.]|uniref:glucokinase n=1 Tax=Rhodopseudomonas sp. TaxID=1078 RepID=UPI0017A0DD96|nr:glucokinase [Rhodopseudomonas sp.]NVN88309.1 glucokinase [Rhodopseudomonas sp.]
MGRSNAAGNPPKAGATDSLVRVVLADVGGTNARFALLTGDVLGPVEHLAVRDHARFTDALAVFMARQTDHATIRGAIIAVAGPVEDGHCAFTNSSWVVDAAELRSRFDFTGVKLINDFEAIAWALPHLTRDDLRVIGGGAPVPDAPMAVLGPGTGLGVAAYVPHKAGGLVLRSEGGHVTLPSSSLREDAIIVALRQRFGHVSAERVLSGQGLENLYRAIATIDQCPAPERRAADISKAAVDGVCELSRAALDQFCAWLGEVAGNVALGHGAQGGVFIAGGIVPHFQDYLVSSTFRSRFEAKGRMSRYVEPIPVSLILHDDPAFVGLRSLALRCDWDASGSGTGV